MFIPAATALKNLVYRVIPTPGQAFHGSVTLTTFYSIFLIFSSLSSFLSSPYVLLSYELKEALCGTDFNFWLDVRKRLSKEWQQMTWQKISHRKLCWKQCCFDYVAPTYVMTDYVQSMSWQYCVWWQDHRNSCAKCCPALLLSFTLLSFIASA